MVVSWALAFVFDTVLIFKFFKLKFLNLFFMEE